MEQKVNRGHLQGLEAVTCYLLDPLIPHTSAAPEQEAAEYWVLFDAKADRRYIKKCIEEGTLAFFDNESDAKRAKLRNPGTDYKRVAYYTHADPSEVERLRAELAEAKKQLGNQRANTIAQIDAHSETRQQLFKAQALLNSAKAELKGWKQVAPKCTDSDPLIGGIDVFLSATARPADHDSDCSTNNRGVPELLGPCDCKGGAQ